MLSKLQMRNIVILSREENTFPVLTTRLFLCRVLMVRLEQEASVDLLEEREKLVPLDLLDPLELLDSPLVPFTPWTVGHNCGL